MKKSLLLVNVVVLLVVGLLVCYKFTSKKIILDNVSLKDNTVKKSLAIMVEQGDGTYQESNTYPANYMLNETLSGCIDKNGKEIENSISYNNGAISFRINSSSYCYVYFDIPPLGEYLHILNPSGFNQSEEGGLYRFQGTNPNNYVCFGTSDKDTCLSNTSIYMYRIIGVNSNGQVKLLKKNSMGSYYWDEESTTNNTWWPNSDIYYAINGSSYLSNSSYIPSGWSDKIAGTDWKYGDNYDVAISAESLYQIENAFYYTINAKIGLLYAHDYAYAYQSGGLDCSETGSYTTCKNSWIYNGTEWLMSRWGRNAAGGYRAWQINANGYITSMAISASYSAVRPVFYLNTTVTYVSGAGTSTDPYIIS